MKHTKSLIKITEESVSNFQTIDGLIEIGQTFQISSYDVRTKHEERKANAQRIVSCWNACHKAGLTNEQLESGYIKKLIQEREEAINLLKAMNNHLNKVLGEYKNEAI